MFLYKSVSPFRGLFHQFDTQILYIYTVTHYQRRSGSNKETVWGIEASVHLKELTPLRVRPAIPALLLHPEVDDVRSPWYRSAA
jgi:hypothetical protein